jgi:hypothetical protein
MGGTREGGQQAAQTNKDKYGEDFYKRIGAIGGMNGRTGGFYQNRELARVAGSIGGAISRHAHKRKVSEKRRREIKKAYEHLLAIGRKAERERKKRE